MCLGDIPLLENSRRVDVKGLRSEIRDWQHRNNFEQERELR